MAGSLSLPGVDALPPVSARQVALSQWHTPADAAARMVACVARSHVARVLEPSAGHGSLVRALLALHETAHVDAVELDPLSAERLPVDSRVRIDVCDYLTRPAPTQRYTLGLANPPYEGGLDGRFLAKLLDECDRVVALIRIAALCGAERFDRVWSRVESGEWRVVGLHPFSKRPSFLAAGVASESAKSDFVVVRLTRMHGESGVPMEWW